MDDVEYAYTTGMDDEDVADRLRDAGTGVLALAKGDDAYAVPLTHFFDGEQLYLRLGRTPDSEKWAWIEATERATYVAYGTEPTDDPAGIESWSVLLTGRLREVTDEERDALDAAEINRRFSPIRVFDEAPEDVEIVVLVLDVETATGRETVRE